MKGKVFFIYWIFGCALSYAQQRIIPEREYEQFQFTYHQVTEIAEKIYFANQ